MKEYLGDSVYIEWSGHDFIMTTDNGHGPSNTIYFDFDVLRKLTTFSNEVKKVEKIS